MASSQQTNATEDTVEYMDDTEKLNFILEKIHVESIESLTQEEINFLKKYSES
jgi:dihydroneopterin aldolase